MEAIVGETELLRQHFTVRKRPRRRKKQATRENENGVDANNNDQPVLKKRTRRAQNGPARDLASLPRRKFRKTGTMAMSTKFKSRCTKATRRQREFQQVVDGFDEDEKLERVVSMVETLRTARRDDQNAAAQRLVNEIQQYWKTLREHRNVCATILREVVRLSGECVEYAEGMETMRNGDVWYNASGNSECSNWCLIRDASTGRQIYTLKKENTTLPDSMWNIYNYDPNVNLERLLNPDNRSKRSISSTVRNSTSNAKRSSRSKKKKATNTNAIPSVV